MTALYPSQVKLAIDHNEQRDAAGNPTFTLSIVATDPVGFPPYLDGTNPHCCFVYERGDLNVLTDAKLKRIATVDDLKTLAVETGYVGGATLFRSNTFIQAYGSDTNMLLEQESIFRSLFVLYQDIRTLYSELVNTRQHEQYLLPDGYHDQVDTQIKQLLNYRASKLQKEELYKAITQITIPSYTSQMALLTSMTSIVNSVQQSMSDESTNITEKMTTGKVATESLQTVFEQADSFLSEDNVRKTDVNSLATDIDGLAATLPTSTTADDIRAKAQSIVAKVTPRQTTFITLPAITQIRQVMAPAMGLIRQIDANKIIAYTNLDNISKLIDSRTSTIKQQLKAKQAEADALQLDIELTRKNIQTIEGRLKVLMPSIDLNYPDNKWSVLVNILPSEAK